MFHGCPTSSQCFLRARAEDLTGENIWICKENTSTRVKVGAAYTLSSKLQELACTLEAVLFLIAEDLGSRPNFFCCLFWDSIHVVIPICHLSSVHSHVIKLCARPSRPSNTTITASALLVLLLRQWWWLTLQWWELLALGHILKLILIELIIVKMWDVRT